MRRFLDAVYGGSLALAGVFLVGIFVLMIAESVLRKLGSYVPGASEMVGWFCAAAGFLALPATFKRGDMVRVAILVERAPLALRRMLLLACLALALVFTTYMLWAAGRYLFEGWRSDETTQGMIEIAVWIPQLSFLLGALLLLVAVIDELIVTLLAPVQTLVVEKAPDLSAPGQH